MYGSDIKNKRNTMKVFYTSEPCIQTMGNDSSGFASYQLYMVSDMQENTILDGRAIYNGEAYCPDGNDDLDFMQLMRPYIQDQISSLAQLTGWNSQGCMLIQSTFAYNTYFTVHDNNNNTDTDYSILYDTRGLTAYEAGTTNINNVPTYGPYTANLFPDKEILYGQYFSLTYRHPTNALQMRNYSFGMEYAYSAGGYNVIAHNVLDSSVTGQSFRYCGRVDWQDWTDGASNVQWGKFFLYDPEKEEYTYITPKLYPKWCDEPDTVYLYWLNSLGGIEFVRGVLTETDEHEDSTYETNAGINDYHDGWGIALYSQRKWKSYSFSTRLVSDGDSPAVADICGARFAWLYFPGRVQPWKTVRVTDARATVKTFRNQGGKLYNYTWELEDSVKAKTI